MKQKPDPFSMASITKQGNDVSYLKVTVNKSLHNAFKKMLKAKGIGVSDYIRDMMRAELGRFQSEITKTKRPAILERRASVIEPIADVSAGPEMVAQITPQVTPQVTPPVESAPEPMEDTSADATFPMPPQDNC